MNKPSGEVSRVLVLNTGGTIGMVLDPDKPDIGLVPAKNKFLKVCRSDPSLNDEKFRKQLISTKKLEETFLVLPATHSYGVHDTRVAYNFKEYDQLIDSSKMTVKVWQKICKDIRDNYEKYDGFVILHGTDTMAYTASALSFMLMNLQKTVIITGSQKPIFDTRTDGPNNFVSSILIAGLDVVPEVTIFFFDRLLRGNRSIKRSSDEYFGFDSCNVPPLMTFGVRIQRNDCIIPAIPREKFHAHLAMNDNVSLLRIFPGISSRAIQAALGEPYQGIVLHTYGAGNVPSDRKDLIEAIKAATRRGAIVVNCTQCPYGPVAGIYETGTILTRIGVLSGSDMTVEAALAKLMFVLSMKRTSLAYKKRLMSTVIRGEMTLPGIEEEKKKARKGDKSKASVQTKVKKQEQSVKSKATPTSKSRASLKSMSRNGSTGRLGIIPKSDTEGATRPKRSNSTSQERLTTELNSKSSDGSKTKGIQSNKDKPRTESRSETSNESGSDTNHSARKKSSQTSESSGGDL